MTGLDSGDRPGGKIGEGDEGRTEVVMNTENVVKGAIWFFVIMVVGALQ
ncbi:hypothetical protein ACFLSJ_03485 [Verrucomicrobiota bacterium]